jgi:hypothetical protein
VRARGDDPLIDFPDRTWVTLANLTGHRIVQVRTTLRIYLSALEAVGYRLVRVNEADRPTVPKPTWKAVSEEVTYVLGDVASDREMGVVVPFEDEVAQVVAAVRKVIEP